jgi:hypothetical protein
MDEGADQALRFFGVGVEGEVKAGAEHALYALRVKQAREGAGLARVVRECVPQEQGVTVAAVLERADIVFRELQTCGGENLAPVPMQYLPLPDELHRRTKPVAAFFRVGPALLAVSTKRLCAVTDGAAERHQLARVGRLDERLEDGFQENGAIEIAVEEAEVEELGVAGGFFVGLWGHGRMVAGLGVGGRRLDGWGYLAPRCLLLDI